MNREAYLDALGITVWALRKTVSGTGQESASPDAVPAGSDERSAPAAPPATGNARSTESKTAPAAPESDPANSAAALGLSLGPGQGSCLFLCGSEDDMASPLASDLARVPGGAPVWAKTALAGGGVSLETAVQERLFTAVVIFGQAQAMLALGGAAPERCGAAQVVVVPELKRLAADPAARRQCWQTFKGLGLGGDQ